MHPVLLHAVSALGALLMLWALWLCFKPPVPRWQWAWVLLIALGFAAVTLVPDGTGGYRLARFAIALFRKDAATDEGEAAVTVMLPVGALIFLAWRRARKPR